MIIVKVGYDSKLDRQIWWQPNMAGISWADGAIKWFTSGYTCSGWEDPNYQKIAEEMCRNEGLMIGDPLVKAFELCQAFVKNHPTATVILGNEEIRLNEKGIIGQNKTAQELIEILKISTPIIALKEIEDHFSGKHLLISSKIEKNFKILKDALNGNNNNS